MSPIAHAAPLPVWLAPLCEGLGLGAVLGGRLTELGRNTWMADVACAKGAFSVRLAAARQASWAACEQKALQHLAGCGLRVPRLLHTATLGPELSRRARTSFGWPQPPTTPRPEPAPVTAKNIEAATFHSLAGKERATFSAGTAHLEATGLALGWLHRAGANLPMARQGPLDLNWVPTLGQLGRDFVPHQQGAEGAEIRADARSLADALAAAATPRRLPRGLPRGLVHGDLRPRVVRFEGDDAQPRAHLIDLREVAHGPLLVDVAAALCHWAFVHDNLHGPLAQAFLHGYTQARPLQARELAALPAALEYASTAMALRTLLRHERTPHPHRPYADYRHFVRRRALLRQAVASLPAGQLAKSWVRG